MCVITKRSFQLPIFPILICPSNDNGCDKKTFRTIRTGTFDQLEPILFRKLLAARNERGILKKVRAIVPGTLNPYSTKPLQKVNGLSAPEATFALCWRRRTALIQLMSRSETIVRDNYFSNLTTIGSNTKLLEFCYNKVYECRF